MRFSVKVPRVGLSGLNRAKPSHIRHSHIILRRISTSFVGSNRRRQQDSRKGCRLPASRRVFGVFGQSRGEPHNARLPPIFSLKTTDSKITGSQGRPCRDFRWDTILPGGLPGFYVRLPQVAPWRLQPGRPSTSNSSTSYYIVIQPLSSDHIDDGARSAVLPADSRPPGRLFTYCEPPGEAPPAPSFPPSSPHENPRRPGKFRAGRGVNDWASKHSSAQHTAWSRRPHTQSVADVAAAISAYWKPN